MSKMNIEELFESVQNLETENFAKIKLFNIVTCINNIINNQESQLDLHQNLLGYLSEKNKIHYSTNAQKVRALSILKYSILIVTHSNIKGNKAKFISKINALNLSADEADYVKIITRSANLGDSDLIVVPSTENSSNQSLAPEPAETTENIQPVRFPPQKTSASNIPKNWFTDWQDFAATPFGFLFTVGTPIIGVVAFIVLSQFNMNMVGGMVLAGAVFGDIALGFMASKLQKHGFFKCCGVRSDEFSPKSNSNFLTNLN